MSTGDISEGHGGFDGGSAFIDGGTQVIEGYVD